MHVSSYLISLSENVGKRDQNSLIKITASKIDAHVVEFQFEMKV